MSNIVYWEGEQVDLDKLVLAKQARERQVQILNQIDSILAELSPEEKVGLQKEIDQKFEEALGWYQVLTH